MLHSAHPVPAKADRRDQERDRDYGKKEKKGTKGKNEKGTGRNQRTGIPQTVEKLNKQYLIQEAQTPSGSTACT